MFVGVTQNHFWKKKLAADLNLQDSLSSSFLMTS